MGKSLPQGLFDRSFAESSHLVDEQVNRVFGQGARRAYTYTVVGDCDGGGKGKLVYKIRDDKGSFKEKWCDSERSGKLTYVGETSFDLGGGDVVNGWVYNGAGDDGVTLAYFFSETMSTQLHSHFILIGYAVTNAGDFVAQAGFLADRS